MEVSRGQRSESYGPLRVSRVSVDLVNTVQYGGLKVFIEADGSLLSH